MKPGIPEIRKFFEKIRIFRDFRAPKGFVEGNLNMEAFFREKWPSMGPTHIGRFWPYRPDPDLTQPVGPPSPTPRALLTPRRDLIPLS